MTTSNRRLDAMAAAMLVCIAALITVCLHMAWQLRGDTAELDRARGVHALMQRIGGTMLELETSQRGYLLTLEESDLASYRAGLARLDAMLAGLSVATADRPDLEAALGQLRVLVDARRAELQRTIEEEQAPGAGPAPAAVLGSRDKALMEDIYQVLSRLDAMDDSSTWQRQAERSAILERREQLVRLLSIALAMLVVALIVLLRRDRALQARTLQWLDRRVHDRTHELQAAARSLALNEARLRGIFESATDGILTTDAEQIIIEANPAAARQFGCTLSDLIGAPLGRLIPARMREAHADSVRAFGASAVRSRRMGGSDYSRMVTALRFDGEEFPIEASISHAEVGGQRLYTVIHRDITERVAADTELKESRSRLHAALASMTDAVCVSDAEGRVVEFNDACVSFHRFHSREECCQTLAAYRETFDVFMADGTPAPPEQWAVPRALRGETASSVEYRLRRKDTGQGWVGSYSFAPFRGSDGTIVGSVVSARDMTLERQIQADLAASRDMLQRLMADQQQVQEEERKRIARELHDDLQQSLAAIRMDAVAIGERLAKGQDNVAALLSRIDRLSESAIVSTRRIVSDLRPAMLEELGLVPALEALCAQHAQRTGSVCRLEAAPALPAQLDGPLLSIGLYRVTQEALNNVARHAKADTVTVHLDCTQSGLVLLRIADDGVGFQPRGGRETESFGLLGMAERVRSLGGQLRIDSQAGQGTMIEALVPILTPAPTPGQPPADPPPWGLYERPGNALGPDVRATSGHRLQTVIDAVDGCVAVLDGQGVIQSVNTAWRDIAAHHGDPDLLGCGPGVNYLEVCRRSAANDPSVETLLKGLTAVLEGHEAAFVTEYPCDTPGGVQWFRLHAASITGGSVIVTHAAIHTVGERGNPEVLAPDAPVH